MIQIKVVHCYWCDLGADTYIGGYGLCRYHADEMISKTHQIGMIILPPEVIYNHIVEYLILNDEDRAVEVYEEWLDRDTQNQAPGA